MKKIVAIVLLIAMLGLTGCYTHMHKVGAGAQGNTTISQQQWYILWGLVPLNDVDTNAIAAGATNYEITTQHSPLDIVISLFTGIVTVYPKTVTVTK